MLARNCSKKCMQLTCIRAYRIYQRPKAFTEGFVRTVWAPARPSPPTTPLRRYKQLQLTLTAAQLSLWVDSPPKCGSFVSLSNHTHFKVMFYWFRKIYHLGKMFLFRIYFVLFLFCLQMINQLNLYITLF